MKVTLPFLAAAAAALAVALGAPLATTVLGLIAFGVLHNVLELRYVTGRFAPVLDGRFLAVLFGLISAIVLCRIAAMFVGQPARDAEILVGYAVLAAGCAHALRGWPLAGAGAILAVAAAVSLAWPGYHFVVLAHLHNVVPLCFLWEWAATLPAATRRWFRATQVGWVLVVPAAVLAGAFDVSAVSPSTVAAFAGEPARIVALSAPPGSDPAVGARFLVVFAFLQTMHYFVWVWFLPRYAPDAARAFERRVPWLRGPRAWALGAGLGLALAVLFAVDYASGRALYSAFASYHAYLEFPVLLALVLGTGAARSQLVFRETASDGQHPAAVSTVTGDR
ncbi:hypothetical protein Daura_50415 [Dactylosporangium aurantiacum]|uniref:Uncharacterized protein n=1 Tax=Dactylosporangium aurantiacum TaxID=35754 RepID=A0A9Q9IK52_9ACTN|nr:hypothetical protein [Dactylosporangium aurantiacum]MDG6109053.1 hypothetical protein [Dactylosporangium aurantiacum]UWZ54553.1 hypothetical protein Daura_50415 [Dactylosporangium aurantiacum]